MTAKVTATARPRASDCSSDGDEADPRLSAEQLEGARRSYPEPWMKGYLEFSAMMNGAKLKTPNHLVGRQIDCRPLRVRQIFSAVESSVSSATVQSQFAALASELPDRCSRLLRAGMAISMSSIGEGLS